MVALAVLAALAVLLLQSRPPANGCKRGEIYVERVIGGWKETPPSNIAGLFIPREQIQNDLVQ